MNEPNQLGKAYWWLIDHDLIGQTSSWSAEEFKKVFPLTGEQAVALKQAVADYHDPVNRAVDLSDRKYRDMLHEAVGESIHGGLEGFSPDEKVAIMRYLTDLKRYINTALSIPE